MKPKNKMEYKTKIKAEDGKQDLIITREFDLPLHLLFMAYVEPDIVAQWMGTKVVKLENKKHGSYQFETTDHFGNKHIFSGVIHDFVLQKNITRTFEMENTPFPAQLEFLDFEALTEKTSKLTMQIIYKSEEYRSQILKLPFVQGINMAHQRLEDIFKNLK
jgi:uncharacterized protein YndB with AHSA1/START domain